MKNHQSIRMTAFRYGIVFSVLYFFLIFLSHTYVIKQLSDESRKQHLATESKNFLSIFDAQKPETDEIRDMITQFQLLLGHAIIVEMEDRSIVSSKNFDHGRMRDTLESPEGFMHISEGAKTLYGLKKITPALGSVNSITIFELEEALAQFPQKVHLTLIGASAVLLLILLALNGMTIHLALKPIGNIKEDLRRLQSGKQNRLSSHVPEEFSPLVDQLNNLIDLENRRLDRHRRLNSDLSHLVKTSISANLAILSNIDLRPPTPKDIDFMRCNLRDLAKSLDHRMSKADISGRQVGKTCLPVELTKSVITVIEKIYPTKVFRLQTDLSRDFRWPIEKHDLSELLGNLLENAGKWCRTAVDVSLAHVATDLIIEVTDDGPGIPPEAAAQVRKRGTRLDESVAGFGLGLSIVSEIVADSAGTMEIGSPETAGTRIVINLPYMA